MSRKLKFSKLQLSKYPSNEVNSTVSKFFSQSNTNQTKENKALTNDENKPMPVKISKRKNSIKLSEDDEKMSVNKLVATVSNEEDIKRSNNSHTKTLQECSDSGSELSPVLKKKIVSSKTSITKFFNESTDESDFISPVKQQKKTSSKFNEKPKNLIKRKRQPKINNMLLRNEMKFSKMLAEQSIAENINPDDIQMALALSRSEIEMSGVEEDDIEALPSSDSPINVRKKLKRYEFKATRTAYDYDFTLFLPSKSKGKWANKFTPLTLRCSEKQSKKLVENVEKILNEQQILDKRSSEEESELMTSVDVTSDLLLNLKANERITSKNSLASEEDISYYVRDFVKPSKVKAGYLLKDYRKIPGRERSPVKIVVTKSSEEACQKIQSEDVPSKFSTVVVENHSAGTDSHCMKVEKLENNISRETSPDLFADYEEIYLKDMKKNEESTERTEKLPIEKDPDDEECVVSFERFSSDDGNKLQKNSEANIKEKNEENNEVSQHLSILSDAEICDQEQGLISESVKENSSELCNYNNDLSQPLFISESESNEDEQDIISSLGVVEQYVDLTQDSTSEAENEEHFKIVEKKDDVSKKINNSFGSTEEIPKFILSQTHFSKQPESECDLSEDERHEGKENVRESPYFDKSKDDSETKTLESNLSQNSSASDCVIILSDDEVNYSMKKVNKIFLSNIDENMLLDPSVSMDSADLHHESEQKRCLDEDLNACTSHNISLIELISEKNEINPEKSIDEMKDIVENYDQEGEDVHLHELSFEMPDYEEQLPKASTQEIFDESFFDLKKLKAQFGILDERTPLKMKSPKSHRNSKYKKSLSESFVRLPSINNEADLFKRHSSNTKFKEFIEEDLSDFDEFDRMVYGSPVKKLPSPVKPQGMDKLLTGEISIKEEKEPKEITFEGKVYLVRTENIPEKPDFKRMDSPTRLKELYKYGLKPLKKKQAVIMLEYIYNQTHPYLEKKSTEVDLEEKSEKRQENNNYVLKLSNEKNVKENKKEMYCSLNLKDCFGDVLLRNDEISSEQINEEYFLPTNVRSKVSTVLLPLHIAWFNLVKSSDDLRESLLYYEPIDLQEIYLFFKKLGYRYNPKDMKKFFDSRCIIFRYDLSDGTNNRHTRKLLPKRPR